jgi:hypothetical protein
MGMFIPVFEGWDSSSYTTPSLTLIRIVVHRLVVQAPHDLFLIQNQSQPLLLGGYWRTKRMALRYILAATIKATMLTSISTFK